MADDLDRPLQHHEEGAVAIALGEQDFPRADCARMTSRGERGEVLSIESRKCDLVTSMVFYAGHSGSYLKAISPWQVLS
jgi:hypothetical protein